MVITLMFSGCSDYNVYNAYGNFNRIYELDEIPNDENKTDYIIQLFYDFNYYSRNSNYPKMVDWRWFPIYEQPTFVSYVERLRNAFMYCPNTFAEAALLSPRNGRQSIILAGFYDNFYIHYRPYMYSEWLEMLQLVMLEENPTYEYINGFLNDRLHYLTVLRIGLDTRWRCNLHESRLMNAFIRNTVDFLEALNKADESILVNAMVSIKNTIVSSMMHPFLFQEFDNILKYAEAADLNEGASILLTNLREAVDRAYLGNKTMPYRQMRFEQAMDHPIYLYTNMELQRSLKPSPHLLMSFEDNYAWVQLRRFGGIVGNVIHGVELQFRYYLLPELRILSFNFWEWHGEFDIYWVPGCPIWQMAVVTDSTRSVSIVTLIEHLIEMRERGADYEWIVDMLSDYSRIFDSRTRDTFEMVNTLLLQHNLITPPLTKWSN